MYITLGPNSNTYQLQERHYQNISGMPLLVEVWEIGSDSMDLHYDCRLWAVPQIHDSDNNNNT